MEAEHETLIRSIVRNQVIGYAEGFEARHMAELDDDDGVINSKVHNIFVAALGPEVQFYSALVRSLDSSLGGLVERIAIEIARLNFDVSQSTEGLLYREQTLGIAELLEQYKSRRKTPMVEDYQYLRKAQSGPSDSKRHESDYVLRHRTTGKFALIELKLGGDLDNKKARSEKEALLEQFCILCNLEGPSADVTLHFAAGYNRYGEGRPWKQTRVLQFFAEDELLISGKFWNFVAQDADGFQVVIDEYRNTAHLISDALKRVKSAYIPN